MNLLIIQGLPKELKNQKIIVIEKPGTTKMSHPKADRCKSLLGNVARLTKKAVAQYVPLEGGGY
jgi:hypothetical protein